MVAVLRAIPHADWRILGRERGELGVRPKLLSAIHPFCHMRDADGAQAG